MKTLALAAVAASVLSAAAPAAALTLGPDPIQIQQVESSASEPESGAPTVVRIAYVNDEQQAARKIVFALSDIAGGGAQVEDVGTFAKGVTIRHDFQAVHLGENVMARVVHVEFADGSTWDAGPAAASDVAMSRPAIDPLPPVHYSL